MLVICVGWVYTWTLGLNVRRLRRASGERDALLDSGGFSRGMSAKSRRHQKLSSALLFLTVLIMFVGMANTFARTGRLFPGPHLYGAFVMVLAICANVALAPWLREKTELRLFHTAIGGMVILLVFEQLYSGFALCIALVKVFLRK